MMRHIRVGGHCVEVTADQHALGATEFGARDNCVAEAADSQMRRCAQGSFDEIGQYLLLVRLTRNIDQGSGQRHHVDREVKP